MQNPEHLPFPFFAPSDRLDYEDIGKADISSHPDFSQMKRSHSKILEVRAVLEQHGPPEERNILKLSEQDIPRRLYSDMRVREQCLAEKAKARAKGLEDPRPDQSREELLKLLAEDYRVFGIAEGEHSARQLIREYESAVEECTRKEIGGQTR